jgi:hypothetical protein
MLVLLLVAIGCSTLPPAIDGQPYDNRVLCHKHYIHVEGMFGHLYIHNFDNADDAKEVWCKEMFTKVVTMLQYIDTIPLLPYKFYTNLTNYNSKSKKYLHIFNNGQCISGGGVEIVLTPNVNVDALVFWGSLLISVRNGTNRYESASNVAARLMQWGFYLRKDTDEPMLRVEDICTRSYNQVNDISKCIPFRSDGNTFENINDITVLLEHVYNFNEWLHCKSDYVMLTDSATEQTASACVPSKSSLEEFESDATDGPNNYQQQTCYKALFQDFRKHSTNSSQLTLVIVLWFVAVVVCVVYNLIMIGIILILTNWSININVLQTFALNLSSSMSMVALPDWILILVVLSVSALLNTWCMIILLRQRREQTAVRKKDNMFVHVQQPDFNSDIYNPIYASTTTPLTSPRIGDEAMYSVPRPNFV